MPHHSVEARKKKLGVTYILLLLIELLTSSSAMPLLPHITNSSFILYYFTLQGIKSNYVNLYTVCPTINTTNI